MEIAKNKTSSLTSPSFQGDTTIFWRDFPQTNKSTFERPHTLSVHMWGVQDDNGLIEGSEEGWTWLYVNLLHLLQPSYGLANVQK